MESSAVAVARRVKVSEMLMQPDIMLSPARTVIGMGSPFTADVSIRDSPDSTTPSTAIRSPTFILTMSPTSISSASTRTYSPPRSTSASSTRSSVTSVIALRLRETAMSSNNSPMRKKSTTPTASAYSPRANAPSVATVIRKFSLNTLPFVRLLTVALRTFMPSTRYAAAYSAIAAGRNCVRRCTAIAAANSTTPAASTAISSLLFSSWSWCSCS